MNYEKPKVVLLASAVDAVRGQDKDDPPNFDGVQGLTISAYQSDE